MFKGFEKLISKYENYRKHLPDVLERQILEETAELLQQKMKRRIFTNGQDSKGEKIADNYGQKPMSVQQNIFIKPSAFKGKKTMKLKHGYKELREIQGLPTDKVNLKYSGDLRESLKVRRRKNAVVIGFSDKNNTVKAKNLQSKYGKIIFRPTKEETQQHLKEVVKRLKNTQKQYFYG